MPFCAFAYIVFFRKQDFSTKLTAFYRAEALKFILTIVFVSIPLNGYSLLNFILFFVGFLLALVLNNFIPFLFNKILTLGYSSEQRIDYVWTNSIPNISNTI